MYEILSQWPITGYSRSIVPVIATNPLVLQGVLVIIKLSRLRTGVIPSGPIASGLASSHNAHASARAAATSGSLERS